MAELPTPGGSEGTWASTLNNYLQVGHNDDGTHKKSDLMSSLGWSPETYAGEESITLPNGVIVKIGKKTVSVTNPGLGVYHETVTYDTAFPNQTEAVFITVIDNSATATIATSVRNVDASGFTIDYRETGGANQDITGIYWLAIGR